MKNKLINITGAILLLIAIAFCSCKQNEGNGVKQTIKRTCDLPDCYEALYTTVYYKGKVVKEWIDDVDLIAPLHGRKIEGENVINKLDGKPDKNITYGNQLSVKVEAIEKREKDSATKQEISYDYGTHKFVLRTLSVASLSLYWKIKEDAELSFLRDKGALCYDRTISGSFNYIKNRKAAQLDSAKKYLHNYYENIGKKAAIEKLIADSIQLLLKTNP